MARQRIEERVMIPRYIKGHVFKDCGEICAHCGKKMEFFGDFTLEHVIPLSKGGTNDTRNFVALCETCNKAKSDDIIPPVEYFPYLPEKKRKALQEMFNEYVTSQDWLDYDNLFMTDWFDITAGRGVILPGSGKGILVPTKFKVRRIREEDAVSRLQDYKKYLTPADAALLVGPNDRLSEPYYIVELNGRELLMFTMYIIDGRSTSNATDWEHILQMDFYFNPEIPHTRVTCCNTMFNVIAALLRKAQETLLNGSQGTAILTRLRSPASAPMARDILSAIAFIRQNDVEAFELELDDHPDGNRIAIVQFIMFQGDDTALKMLKQDCGAKTFSELQNAIDKKQMQEAITERLKNSRRFGRRTW